MSGTWEDAAASVKYPVVMVIGGVKDKPRLSQWGGGEQDAPTSVTLRYETDGLQVTSYAEPLWGDDEYWKDLWGLVESSFGSWWEAINLPLDFDRLTVAETTKTPTEKGHLVLTTYKPLPQTEEEDRRKKTKRAAAEAEHNEVSLDLDGSAVDAKVVSEGGHWAAGFEATSNGAAVICLLDGEGGPPESLRFGCTMNLLAYLRENGAPQGGTGTPADDSA